MTQVTIVTGCAGTGKTERSLVSYQAALDRARSERRPGSALWLTPTRRTQQAISQQIVLRCGRTCFAPNVLTFDRFAEKILEAAGRQASPISPVMKRLLLRRITASLKDRGELRHFQPIAETTGFLDVVSSFISELKREEIWPETFIAACQQRTSTFARRDLELGLIYSEYQGHLANQNWYDNEGRFWLARTALGEGKRGPFSDVRFLVVDGFTDFTQTQYEILGYFAGLAPKRGQTPDHTEQLEYKAPRGGGQTPFLGQAHFAGWIDEILVTLPLEHPLTRTDLFSKPHAAIARIREHLPSDVKLHVTSLRAPDDRDSANTALGVRLPWSDSICVVADRLFCNPRFVQPSSQASGLELIEATGQRGEWEAVARRIKTLLAGETQALDVRAQSCSLPSGTAAKTERPSHRSAGDWPIVSATSARPQDIVIGLRSIADDGPRLADYLTAAGLPVWCEAELPFTSSSIVKAVLLLLQFELEDWPFDRLMAVLDSNFFRPSWKELTSDQSVRAVAAILRRLRIHEGRDLMLRTVRRYADEALLATTNKANSLSELARLAAPLLVKLSRSLEKLRRSYSLADWADVLAAIVDDLGVTNQVSSAGDPLAKTEKDQLDLFQRILRTAAEADQKLSGTVGTKRLDLAAFSQELRDLLGRETLKSSPEPSGCIRILSVEQIRNLEVAHLFLVGLTENSFPQHRADDCLFSEAERQDFISRGVALSHRSAQHADEMFLFYSVVTRARRSLTLSYPAVNSKGQPVFPSPYVTALRSLFDPSSIQVSAEGHLDPVPTLDRVLTRTDLRLAAMTEALQGRPELFRAVVELEPLRRTCWNTLAACEVADQRFHQRGFTAYEGQLDLAPNVERLRQRFGSHHQYSATELEAYARCPFQFWLSNVLRIGPVESPEEGTDYALRGTLMHDVLAQLLNEGMLADPERLAARFRELVNEQLDGHASSTDLQQALVDVERMILAEWSDAFAGQQGEYDEKIGDLFKDAQPLSAEIPFGSLPDAPAASAESHPPIRFGRGDHTVNLRGRIDRLDVGKYEGKPAFMVIDYKTGQRPSSKDQDRLSGRSIQLALYLVAVKRLGLVGPAAVPFQMGYWALRETGFKQGFGKPKLHAIAPEDVQRLESVLDDLLPKLADELRSGRFVVENQDSDCTSRCDFKTVCRVNQLRSIAELLGKQSPARGDPIEE